MRFRISAAGRSTHPAVNYCGPPETPPARFDGLWRARRSRPEADSRQDSCYANLQKWLAAKCAALASHHGLFKLLSGIVQMMRPLHFFVGPFLLLAATTVASPAQPARAMRLVDLLEIPSLAEPRLSPDGKQLLFTLAEANWKQNRQLRHIWRTEVAGGAAVCLTRGSAGEHSPRWSPAGDAIAFLAKRGTDEHEQIYLLPTAGGEARRITARATGVKQFAWSVGGDSLYFLSAEPRTAARREQVKQQDDVFAFDENFQQVHLWKLGIEDRAEVRITGGDFSILDFRLSRDGTRIVVHRSVNPLFGDSDHGEVHIMGARGEDPVRLTDNRVPEKSARVSPDNQTVLFLAKANAQFEYYYNAGLFLVAASGGPARRVLTEFSGEILEANWSAAGRSVFFRANGGTHVDLFEFNIVTEELKVLTTGDHAVRGWHYSVPARQHVMSIDQPTNPGDVWLLPEQMPPEPGARDLIRVTRLLEQRTAQFQLPRQEKVAWRGADGAAVEGLLIYPLGYSKGERYPLVVQAHGGPASSDRFGFGRWRDYLPILAARGYLVLKPNYRGSTGYGNEFLRDMVGHYFRNAHLDVMAGVDHLIAAGIVDGDRMAIMGWSGGGHMTNKLITFTDRFRAASSGAGAVNWISMYGQSDVRIYRTPWFGGTPWQADAPIEVFWEHSPLREIAKVTTPTLVLVGQNDARVPMAQSVELYRALKSNGVPTHLYVAPRAEHGWKELRHRLFKMNVELEWFERHVRDLRYTWEQAPAGKTEARR